MCQSTGPHLPTARARRPWICLRQEYAIAMPGKTPATAPSERECPGGPAAHLRRCLPPSVIASPNRAHDDPLVNVRRLAGRRPRSYEGIRRDPNFKPYRKGAGFGRMCPSRVEREPVWAEQPRSAIPGMVY
jgi:hypothetical protein